MLDDDSSARLLNALFSAPIDPRRWNDFLRHLGAACGAEKAAFLVRDSTSQGIRVLTQFGDILDDSALHRYECHYWRYDEFSRLVSQTAQPGDVVRGEELLPDGTLLKSVFYNEFLRELDIFRVAAIFCSPPGAHVGIGFYRRIHQDSFGPEEISVLRSIAPYLQTVCETRHRLLALETRVADLETALDSLASALLLVNAEGKIVFVNKQAQAVLAQSKCLFVHKGSLIAQSLGNTMRLRELVEKASAAANGTGPGGGGAMSITRTDKRPLHVLVSPIPRSDIPMPTNAVAAIFLDDPELKNLTPEDLLRTLFRLTPAEAKLARSVLNGDSLSEAAELGGVSRETVKSQISSVFSKTGTRRQGELIRLLSRLPEQPANGAE